MSTGNGLYATTLQDINDGKAAFTEPTAMAAMHATLDTDASGKIEGSEWEGVTKMLVADPLADSIGGYNGIQKIIANKDLTSDGIDVSEFDALVAIVSKNSTKRYLEVNVDAGKSAKGYPCSSTKEMAGCDLDLALACAKKIAGTKATQAVKDQYAGTT